jgi:hypothetical protein
MRFLLTLQFDFEADDHPAGRIRARQILDAIDIEFMKDMPEFLRLKFQQLREYGPPKPISLDGPRPTTIVDIVPNGSAEALLKAFDEEIEKDQAAHERLLKEIDHNE